MMSVYVDDSEIPYRRMIMCHMFADSTAELVEMAKRIGVAPKWIQKKGTYKEHFDVCLSMKEKAVSKGAIEIGMGEVARLLKRRREIIVD